MCPGRLPWRARARLAIYLFDLPVTDVVQGARGSELQCAGAPDNPASAVSSRRAAVISNGRYLDASGPMRSPTIVVLPSDIARKNAVSICG